MKLVFLHGLGQTNDSWIKVKKFMGDGYDTTFISIDELVTTSETITFNQLSKSLTNVLHTINTPFIIIGLSLGGCFALQQALITNPHLRGMVLSGTPYSLVNGWQIKSIFQLQKYIFKLIPAKVWRKQGIEKSTIIPLYQSMVSYDLSHSLHQINIPTLVLVGSKDRINMPAAKELTELIPRAQLQIIEKGNHELNIQMPQQFAKEVETFLVNTDLK
ncbi:alpha/beta fold hydrolase [Cytobacillus sp. Sa5YUA1]|uniref:Alpha/beta fold hydrolase n=1 Tax=Cytobacillus stercorigallinarum TaxID=2762240 RepID=A0ABR8QN69_9BACI|nr:alpha/beta hydrolase [Cytobacillus stercorigallinarum]MBD7936979.1 alpha/beta fold hydrolase [Cytobacillus stercorigallinarum]